MSFQIKVDDREFNQAVTELARLSRRTDEQVLTGQAIQLVRELSFRTPVADASRRKDGRFSKLKNKGRARAGWWAAWQVLGAFGFPRGTTPRVLALGEGSFVDQRTKAGHPFFEMTNSVNYIDKLDRTHAILVTAVAARTADMQQAIDDKYRKMLERKSAR